MSEALARFEAEWLPRLNAGAHTRFHHGLTPPDAGLHSAVADAFVHKHGYLPIGFNWELLDAHGDADSPRSAFGEITKAIANDISNPSKEWLGFTVGSRCAKDFLAAFDSSSLTVVSNRYDGLWNPISDASVEWGFVCFDDKHIALLLIAEQR